jgi:hypothetical protein
VLHRHELPGFAALKAQQSTTWVPWVLMTSIRLPFRTNAAFLAARGS